MFCPSGFNVVRRDRDSRGGGVLLLIRDCISFRSVEVAYRFFSHRSNLCWYFMGMCSLEDCRLLSEWRLWWRSWEIRYRHYWMPKILCTGGRTICFLGDFNLPLAIQPSPKQEDYKIFLGYFMEYGLHQFVRSATSKGNKENILDLIISNKPRILSTIDVLCPIPTSDNNVISFSPNIPLSLVPQTIGFLKLHLMTSSGQITTTYINSCTLSTGKNIFWNSFVWILL